MICAQLDAFFDRELTPDQREAFQNHLAACTRCEAVLLGRMHEAIAATREIDWEGPSRGDADTPVDREPDLVVSSGREGLPVAERVDLLRAALVQSPFASISTQTPATSQEIHDLKLTAGWIRGVIDLYDTAIRRGQTQATLARGASRVLGPVECLVLAFRRGGHHAYQATRRAQIECDASPWARPEPVVDPGPR